MSFPFLELLLHLKIQRSRDLCVAVSSDSRHFSQTLHSQAQGSHLRYAKVPRLRGYAGVGLRLLSVPRTRAHHFEIVSIVQK